MTMMFYTVSVFPKDAPSYTTMVLAADPQEAINTARKAVTDYLGFAFAVAEAVTSHVEQGAL